jgi:hypothetical protein
MLQRVDRRVADLASWTSRLRAGALWRASVNPADGPMSFQAAARLLAFLLRAELCAGHGKPIE